MPEHVVIRGSTTTLTDLEIHSEVVAQYLSRVGEAERPKAVEKALEVGVYCLERVSALNDVDFIRSQISQLLKDVETTVKGIPGQTGELLADRIGVGKGQVLEPVAAAANDVKRAVDEKIQQVRTMLDNDIDPKNERSILGQSLKEIKNLLDPKHNDSIPSVLERACQNLTKGDGDLVKTVRNVVVENVKAIVGRIETIEQQMEVAEKVDEALSKTTAAGRPFEDLVLEKIVQWTQNNSAEAEHVGTDNRSGDVLIKVPKDSLDSAKIAIVVEAKHKHSRAGRKQISDALRDAIETRHASGAVYVCHSTEGFAKEISDWAEGEVSGCGPWVATTFDNLTTAVRFIAAQVRLNELRNTQPQIDTHFISRKVGVLRQSLQHFTNIKTKLTGIEDGADYIRSEANAARELINDAIIDIEVALRAAPGRQGEVEGATANGAPLPEQEIQF